MALGDFLVGGAAARPDSISGFDPRLNDRLTQFFLSAPAEVRDVMRITSGFRSPEKQAQLWQEALTKYGSPEAARKWVAPPGRSNHNHGTAADLKYLSPAAQEWAHANAANYGLAFPLSNEPWHIEIAEARGGKPAMPAGGTGGLSYGAAQPNITSGGAAAIAEMFGPPPAEPVPFVPPQPVQRAPQPAEIAPAEIARRNALFANVGSWFG